MRLADFILANIEPILMEWEDFARGIWADAANAGATTDPATLRDHAEGILRAVAQDMQSLQTRKQQSDKSKGDGDAGEASDCVDAASRKHGIDRVAARFDLGAMVSEYRALRASVLELWRKSASKPDTRDLEDVTRFNETIDQSLAEAVDGFCQQVEGDRAAMAKEQAAREGAESANRAKDTFLAVLSHELRSPLSVIVGWVRDSAERKCNEEDLSEGLDAIERSTGAQAKIIGDLLDVSRIVSGKMAMDPRPCELNGIVQATVHAARPAAEKRGVGLKVQNDGALCHALCDAVRLQQVVENLITNAIKFTPKGGTVTVQLARQLSNVMIEVRDTGEGIDGDFLPHIFERFRQADGSSRRKAGGLGLGLSIVKHIVEAHDGTIEARSDGAGRGSTFTVRLPAIRVHDKADDDRTAQTDADRVPFNGDGDASRFPPVRLDGLRVLVVDDEDDTRRLLERMLEEVGAVVTAAASAAQALETLTKARPEVLVSDIGMPDEDGYDLIRQVRQRGHAARDLPAVALTAFVQRDDQRRALLAGFQVHLPKPVDPHDLTSTIASLAGRTDG